MNSSAERAALILDSHPLWLDAVEQVVERLGIEVIGKTTSPEEALSIIEQRQPDLLLTGIEGPEEGLGGLAVLRGALERQPGLKVIVVSMYADPEHVEAALAAGALAYVVKTAHPEDLASAIRQAFNHSIYLPAFRSERASSMQGPSEDMRGLTRRELEILQLVAEGYPNAQLAKMLWVSEPTIKFHLSNIYRKLEVSNRTEASRWAQVHGVVRSRTEVAGAV